jgi:hypothetical protein
MLLPRMSLLTETPAPRRSNRLFIGIAAGVLLAATGAFAAYRLTASPRTQSPLDTAAGQALGRAVPAFLVEEQESRRKGGSPEAMKERVSSVLEPKAREALGSEAAAHLETLLRTAVDVDASRAPPKELQDQLARNAVVLDQALAGRELPYFIDASIVRTSRKIMPLLYSYYIERESTLEGPDRHVRSLFVRRLDDLNFANAAVGYTKPSSTAALVLLDDIESQLIDFVLPSVAAADETLLVDLDSADPKSDWQRDLRARAATIVKDAYGKLPGAGAPLVDEIGSLLYRRRTLVRSWMKTLDKQRYRLVMPRRLMPEADYASELGGKVAASQVGEWISIHERLLDAPVLAAFDAICDQQARSVEQHETQHQLDYDRDRVILPKPVAEMLGVHSPDDVYDDDFAPYVAGEVSAYLAEIARGADSPALVLMVLSQSAFDRSEWGGAYCYAALAVLGGVGKELGTGGGELIGGRQVDRAALTRLLVAITDKPEQEIRLAARRTWESWFEAKLPEVTVGKTTVHPAWRH